MSLPQYGAPVTASLRHCGVRRVTKDAKAAKKALRRVAKDARAAKEDLRRVAKDAKATKESIIKSKDAKTTPSGFKYAFLVALPQK